LKLPDEPWEEQLHPGRFGVDRVELLPHGVAVLGSRRAEADERGLVASESSA
jgi:hypothetical protein